MSTETIAVVALALITITLIPCVVLAGYVLPRRLERVRNRLLINREELMEAVTRRDLDDQTAILLAEFGRQTETLKQVRSEKGLD